MFKNDPAVNDNGPYAEKTLGATFTTGADITSRQVIYEQGGTIRGMNIFIEGGRAYVAAWNYAEENWGYRDFSVEVDANTEYTVTMILNGVQNETGSLIGFFDGVEVGRFDDVGLLYSHSGGIGFEQIISNTVIQDSVTSGTYAFGGEFTTFVQYNNAVIDGNAFGQLQSFLNGDAGASPFLTPSSALSASSDDVLLYTDSIDNAIGGDGFDTLYATDGLTDIITSDSYDGIEVIDLSQDDNPTQADDVHEVISSDFTTADRVADVTDGGVTYAVFQDSSATLQIELGVILNGETLV